jgi:hypothetical protein
MKLEPVGKPIPMIILPYIDPTAYHHIKETIGKHGGNVTIHETQFHLYFPEGTVQEVLNPMVGGVPRLKILFPDGYWFVYEIADKGRLANIWVDPQPEEKEPI